MSDSTAAKKQQVFSLSQKEPTITKETDRQVFTEITTLYQDYMDQIARARVMIHRMVGNYQNPGTIWKLVEYYGEQPNKEDRQEHVLRVRNKTWSIRRTNNHYKWDTENALELFKLAYVISTAEDGSEKQSSAFEKFKNLLENLTEGGIVSSDEEWWAIINDAADLFRTSVVRMVDVNALDVIRHELSPLLVKALCTRLSPEYSIQFTEENKETKRESLTTVMCKSCCKTVDEDSFFCKYCGNSLGCE